MAKLRICEFVQTSFGRDAEVSPCVFATVEIEFFYCSAARLESLEEKKKKLIDWFQRDTNTLSNSYFRLIIIMLIRIR